jgi:hypothetical protein
MLWLGRHEWLYKLMEQHVMGKIAEHRAVQPRHFGNDVSRG